MTARPHNLPLIGSILDNPAEAAKLAGMRQAGQVYAAERPQIAQARMNALSNRMAALAPVGNAMATMYGPAATPDAAMMLRNPFTGAPPPTQVAPWQMAPQAPPGYPQGQNLQLASLRGPTPDATLDGAMSREMMDPAKRRELYMQTFGAGNPLLDREAAMVSAARQPLSATAQQAPRAMGNRAAADDQRQKTRAILDDQAAEDFYKPRK